MTTVRRMSVTLAMAAMLLQAPVLIDAQDVPPAIQFDEADIFLELNDTDGDLGIHASIDGEPWTKFKIIGPDGLLLDIFPHANLQTQGLTQLSFESAEPPFDELSPSRFFRRFPEGRYAMSGDTLDGGDIGASAHLSHILAAPPDNVRVNTVRAAESCDDPPPTVVPPVLVDWDAVTASHPRIGKRGDVRIRRYQFFVEGESVELGVDLPPSITQFEIPVAVTDRGKLFKFEIIAQTSTGNNTAVESCFRVP